MEASSTKQTFYFDESAASTQWRLITTTAVGNPYSWCLNEVEMFEASNGFGDQGFYLPFTTSDYLGANYQSDYSTTTTSAHFDGSNDYLDRGAALTGISDGPRATIAFWYRVTGRDSNDRVVMTSQDGMFDVTLDVGNNWKIL